MTPGLNNPFKHIRNRLLPRIQLPQTGVGIPWIPGYLDLGLAVSTVGGFSTVSEKDIIRWGSPLRVLLTQAINNLRQKTSTSGWQPVLRVDGLYVFTASDGLSASRMLNLHDFIHPWPTEGVLVAVPTVNQLVAVPLTRTENLDAVRTLLNASEAALWASSMPLSPHLFWYDGFQWIPMPVIDTPTGIEIDPPVVFLDALDRLSSVAFSGAVGEA